LLALPVVKEKQCELLFLVLISTTTTTH